MRCAKNTMWTLAVVAGVLGIGFFLPCTAQTPSAEGVCPVPEPIEAAEVIPLPAPACTEYVWFEPDAYGTGSIAIHVQPKGAQPASDAMVFDVTLEDESSVANAQLRFQIIDCTGCVIHSETRKISIGKDAVTHTLAWCAAEVPEGQYKARFQILRWKGTEVAARDYTIYKIVPETVLNSITASEAALSELFDRLTDTESAISPYARMRLSIAVDGVSRAQQAAAVGDWPTANRLRRYLERIPERVSAQLGLGVCAPELAGPIPAADLGGLQVRNGAFVAQDRPLFLLGRYYGHEWPLDISRLRAYGLGLAGLAIGPKDTLASPEQTAGFQSYLDRIFAQANSENVSVMASLAPAAMPQWAIDKMPSLLDNGQVDITQPEARQIIQRHFATVTPYLAGQKMVPALCVAYQPLLKFTGESTRQAFLNTVEGRYGNRHGVNRAWRGLFGSLDEIAIGWDRDNPQYENTARYMDTAAYRYDWMTFHQGLATDYLNWLGTLAMPMAAGKPLFVALQGDVIEAQASEKGFDLSRLATSSGLSGCSAANTPYDPHYAMGYPQQAMVYTFLRSLAPDKPVVNFGDAVIPPNFGDTLPTYEYVHGTMWEGAISGLNASALATGDLLAIPQCLEAYATASLDLNRLAPIVTAFQQAPADIAILWSSSSTIYANGDPHIQSLRYAYEGCSFAGYKVRFITEEQCARGGLKDVKVLILADTPAVTDAAFAAIKEYVEQDKTLVRTSRIIQFDERGQSRRDILTNTKDTILIRSRDGIQARGYLHGMDAVISTGILAPLPRAINPHGYPLEGVISRYVEVDGQPYLYVMNIRKTPVLCHLTGPMQAGRDLINGRDVSFPTQLESMDPMLIHLCGDVEASACEK